MALPWEHVQIGPNGNTSQERVFIADVQNTFVPVHPYTCACTKCIDAGDGIPLFLRRQSTPASSPPATAPKPALPWASKS